MKFRHLSLDSSPFLIILWKASETCRLFILCFSLKIDCFYSFIFFKSMRCFHSPLWRQVLCKTSHFIMEEHVCFSSNKSIACRCCKERVCSALVAMGVRRRLCWGLGALCCHLLPQLLPPLLLHQPEKAEKKLNGVCMEGSFGNLNPIFPHF